MKKQKVLLVGLVLIIAGLACANFSDIAEFTEGQFLSTETTQPTEEPNPYDEIQATLLSEPPCGGNQDLRREAILVFNEYLKDDYARRDPNIIEFYDSMVGNVASEINQPVLTGARIWSMYNHGFIVKTPSAVIAFDLVEGYSGWRYQFPDVIIEQIQVLFISHRHDDHRDYSLTNGIIDFGGEVIAPLEDKSITTATIYLSPGEELTVAGFHVKAYDGVHGGLPLRIYVVTTPEGLTIMHTGDNQTSETLPEGVPVDILLLNAWVNESGSVSPRIGMSNSINKLAPKLTIPGHIMELGHDYNLGDMFSRLSFEYPLAAAEMSLPGEVSVQIWGEHCDFSID